MKKSPPKFTVSIEAGLVKLRVNGLLHMAYQRCTLVFIHSWIDHITGLFCIELATTKGNTVLEYTDRRNWETVLRLLDQSKIFC